MTLSKAYESKRNRLREAAQFSPPLEYAQALSEFYREPSLKLPPLEAKSIVSSCPLALLGGPFPKQYWELFSLVETSGGHVALNATEAGERSLGLPPALQNTTTRDNPDLERQLSQQFLNSCVDVFQRPNTSLYAWLHERLVQRQIRGILLWQYVACDLWRAEVASLREAFRLPILLMEADEAGGISARTAGRMQAFIETLK